MFTTNIPLLGFAAASGTGKTTLITLLIPRLKKAGVRVGLIKHSHHDFEIDYENKDSFRLRKAGASPVIIVSPYRRATIEEFEHPNEPTLNDQIALFNASNIDLILVEGFRHESFAKIELHRRSLNQPLLYPHDVHIIAVATDSVLQTQLPQLDLNAPDKITAFIVQYILNL